MSDQDQIIGELREFKRMAVIEFRLVRKDLEDLKKFKWMIYASSFMISTTISLLLTLLRG